METWIFLAGLAALGIVKAFRDPAFRNLLVSGPIG